MPEPGSTTASSLSYAAGTYSTPTLQDSLAVPAIGGSTYNARVDLVQLAPQKGHMTWHFTVQSSGTCHLSVQSEPSS